MNILSCKKCGSNDFKVESGFRVCQYCNTKYEYLESGKQTFIQGERIAKSSGISLDSDILQLLEKCKKDPGNARRYVNLILDIDPDNDEALAILKNIRS